MNKLILFFIILLFGCVEDSTKESSCCDDITWDTFGSENYFIPGEMKWSSDRASMTYIIGIEISISSEGRVTELYLYGTFTIPIDNINNIRYVHLPSNIHHIFSDQLSYLRGPGAKK